MLHGKHFLSPESYLPRTKDGDADRKIWKSIRFLVCATVKSCGKSFDRQYSRNEKHTSQLSTLMFNGHMEWISDH
ncbi:uncharacterized protein CIMG_09806 [Coccidioides immitis RS]|uniref:Uncharacterized protein n=1 Tax=Coccidioides immitis (strain RS) TaxID=246410 RepID=A0A0E1RUW5_COCIM|nr:uncharacterized protein CIMG_09806 [Coccidioides immitis RS]EAS28602.2 hypothetical protein CIMG_09806 [Coccidioides immitis RS]